MKPRNPGCPEMARAIRDSQWRFMEKVRDQGIVWWCWWDKAHRHNYDRPKTLNPFAFSPGPCRAQPGNVHVNGLIGGMEMMEWIRSHKDWWRVGKWSDKRYAAPVRLTAAGLRALEEREKYDMEPVTGGLVEPGWEAIPLPKEQAHDT